MSEPFIICQNVVKIYKVADLEVVALQGLDLVVEEGEFMAIIGTSGSGKSTLMNCLGGLDRPSAGVLRVGGYDLLKMSEGMLDKYRRTQVGFVWQQVARNLLPYLSARQNIELPMQVNGTSGRERRRWADELLDAVSLGDQANKRLGQMSGGQQQRVALAVALANRPRLLLADEPTGEVDSTTTAQILNILSTLNRTYDTTMVLVTHDQAVAQVVDRVVAIRDGRTSSETLRRTEGEDAQPHHDQELVVLDAAGRLQLPRSLLEQFSMADRVQVEASPEGILVRPVQGAAKRVRGVEEVAPPPRRGLFARLRRRGD